MTRTPAVVLAVLAVLGLMGAPCSKKDPAAPGNGATTATNTPPAATKPPTEREIAELLPGVPLESLTGPQREVVLKVAQDEFCYCGCPHTLAGCLREHKTCHHAPKMVALVARLASGGLTAVEILKTITEYYASFDIPKRTPLNTKDYGPAKGKENAPVTMVEFADFTCPHCQQMRPMLESFVLDNPSRVKLFYKPFPLAGHEPVHAFEAAEAVEWARGKGIFWPMHDALFAHPDDLKPTDLVTYAKQLGANGEELHQALESKRLKPKVDASLSEAKAAGIMGTPTLFFNGRMYALPELTEPALAFTLADEEEWMKHNGWNKD